MMKVPSVTTTAASMLCASTLRRTLVSLHGHTALVTPRLSSGLHHVAEKPPDPLKLLSDQEQQEASERLLDWFDDKKQVLCLTGAGISTESGIPDYRGHNGSYHHGHKPMIHDQFMKSESNRRRYWGRGLVGWRSFDERQPAAGHVAIAELEGLQKLGVQFPDRVEFYQDVEQVRDEAHQHQGLRRLALITQNVDSLHRRAGSRHLIELHGRTDRLECMNCGSVRHRDCFHSELERLNADWLAAALEATQAGDLRADGDALVRNVDYGDVQVPPCTQCGGFMKPDVVFFGDSVPVHRVARVRAALDHADGLIVIGSSLAVHSAFRHVRAAHQQGIPICILNVGTTRAETEGLNLLKIEAPIGPTLSAVASHYATEQGASTGESPQFRTSL